MKGFTLIEIIVASLIMSVIMAALFVALSIGQNPWFSGDAVIELRDQTIRSIMNMDKELSETRPSKINLAIGATSSTVTFYVPQDNNGDGSVVDSAGNIEWSGAISYSLNSSNQIIRASGGASTIIGIDIATLQFTMTESRLIQIDITARKTALSKRQMQDTEQAVIKIRN